MIVEYHLRLKWRFLSSSTIRREIEDIISNSITNRYILNDFSACRRVIHAINIATPLLVVYLVVLLNLLA